MFLRTTPSGRSFLGRVTKCHEIILNRMDSGQCIPCEEISENVVAWQYDFMVFNTAITCKNIIGTCAGKACDDVHQTEQHLARGECHNIDCKFFLCEKMRIFLHHTETCPHPACIWCDFTDIQRYVKKTKV